MSSQEIKRLEVMRKLEDKRMRQGEAAEELGVSERQVRPIQDFVASLGPHQIVNRG